MASAAPGSRQQAFTVGDLVKEQADALKLELVTGERSLGRPITVSDLNRPGLALSGFLDHFRAERIQIIGNGEQSYCNKTDQSAIEKALSAMLASPELPCLIMTHSNKTPPVLARLCKKNGVPLLRSGLDTATVVGELSAALEARLAPATQLHGGLVDVYGLGVLIQGEPGIGKSECALELVKRGHILIADDIVEIQHRRGGVLKGTCPEPIRNYIEVRGLGIIDIKLLFGVGSILERSDIGLSVYLEPWKRETRYERVGLDTKYKTILDVQIPEIRIPVSPGRNIAALIEVAALNQRLRSQGYFSAETFNKKLIARMR